LNTIIAGLEQQHVAVSRALAALREVEGLGTGTATAAEPKRRGGMTPEGKKRLIAALKRRWAERKKAAKKAAQA
jgi:hypothetical protein